MMTDPIADMLSRIRNAAIGNLDRTEMPRSKMKIQIARVLKEQGYISDYRESDEGFGTLTVFLKYSDKRKPAIVGIQRKSRPGRRFYCGFDDIPTVLNGLGTSIMSTSSGILTDKQAREKRVGGEVLAEVW
jgi:small subunit ribosomal protein S8